MHLRLAFISLVSIGIIAIPTSVDSFNIHSTVRISNSNTALRVSTTDDQTMEAMIELDLDVIKTTSTTVSEEIVNASNRKNNKRSKNKSKRGDPSKDILFLVKRTNQILSHQPVPSTKKSINLSTFHWLIDAWTASRHPTAPEHSLGLMNSMMDYNVTPTAKTLTKVINSYAKCGRGGDIAMNIMKSFAGNGETNRKQSVVIEPNIYVLNAVLEAYAKDNETGDATAIKAEQLLQSMLVTEDDQDNKKIRKKEEYSIPFSVVPDARSFQSLIHAWSNSKAEIGAAKAEQIIDWMEKLYKNKKISVRPNIIHYNTVLDAWAKSTADGTTWHVENLIERMTTNADDKIHPDTISYNSCINAYANVGDFEKAAALVQKMEDAYDLDKNTKIKPNTISYNGVINAFAKSLEKDAGERAEEYFRRLQKRYEESNRDLDFKPDIISFASVINAWARSFDYQKAKKAFQIYQEMLKLYKAGDSSLQPNTIIVNSILNACAYTIGDTFDQRHALEIANYLLKELDGSSYGRADEITYGMYLKVCENEMPPSEARVHLVDLVFNKCAKEGQVGQFVFDEMKNVSTSSQFQELFGDVTNYEDLPKEWTRHVGENQKHHLMI